MGLKVSKTEHIHIHAVVLRLQKMGLNLNPGGEMASDLYGPQFWDDNFQFSFSVVVSCKSNKQLGYF